jgi:hypothetical protein
VAAVAEKVRKRLNVIKIFINNLLYLSLSEKKNLYFSLIKKREAINIFSGFIFLFPPANFYQLFLERGRALHVKD